MDAWWGCYILSFMGALLNMVWMYSKGIVNGIKLWWETQEGQNYLSPPFELMSDASVLELGVVLGQRKDKLFHPIYYARKSLNNAQCNYTMTEQQLLVVVYAFKKFCTYFLGTKVVVNMDHTIFCYLISKKEPNRDRWGGYHSSKSLTLKLWIRKDVKIKRQTIYLILNYTL